MLSGTNQMLDQSKSVLAARNAFNALYNISQLLNTGLSKEELMICVRLCEKGINPTMLANIIVTMKNEMKNYNDKALKETTLTARRCQKFWKRSIDAIDEYFIIKRYDHKRYSYLAQK